MYTSKHINATPDPISAQELVLFIENDGNAYRQQYTPILKNLSAKKASGKYQHDLAVKLFVYLADAGAKQYYAEVVEGRRPKYWGDTKGVSQEWARMFPVAVRKGVAEELTEKFETEYGLGNYSEMVPKKYQPKPEKKPKAAKRGKASRATPGVSLKGMR
jgi:hypothetical protein